MSQITRRFMRLLVFFGSLFFAGVLTIKLSAHLLDANNESENNNFNIKRLHKNLNEYQIRVWLKLVHRPRQKTESLFFDLPTTSQENRRAYTLFRRFLIKDGYDMIQWSVYGRIVNGIDAAEKHLKRLENNLPKWGAVRCLQVSEKQFAGMRLLVGKQNFQEKKVHAEQLLLF